MFIGGLPAALLPRFIRSQNLLPPTYGLGFTERRALNVASMLIRVHWSHCLLVSCIYLFYCSRIKLCVFVYLFALACLARLSDVKPLLIKPNMCVFMDVCMNKQIPQMAHWTDTGLPRRLATNKFITIGQRPTTPDEELAWLPAHAHRRQFKQNFNILPVKLFGTCNKTNNL